MTTVKVLAIDDNTDDLVLIRELLATSEDVKYVVDFQTESRGALERILGQQHDVYLIDYHLGDTDGVEILSEARAKGCEKPMILWTGQGSHDVDVEAMKRGASDYLVKGRTEASLLERSLRYAMERYELQSKLARKATALARTNAELEQFVYVASHDLKEPIRMVGNFTELLARRHRGNLGEEADEFIRFILDGVDRMQNLVQDLLAFACVGNHEPKLEPVDCASAVGQANTQLASAITEHGAEVTCGALPTVQGIESRLIELFQNLISNSIKFRSAHVPRVHIEAREVDQGWLFSVKDNGIGIEPEYRERIFTIFQRLHDREEYPGTGIGLAICKKVVELHGGRIWVESERGEGATFYFTIPRRDS